MIDQNALKYIFGGAIAAMAARANKISLSNNLRDICRAFALGFELLEQDGDNIYTNGILENDITTTEGFGLNSIYETYENNVRLILDSYNRTSSLDSLQRQILAATVNSILFGYVGNPNIHIKDLYNPIGNTLSEISKRILNLTVFE